MTPPDKGEEEDRPTRLDRELIELLNELRVVLPGVQVVFAFLLTVPFSQRFDRITPAQRVIFLVGFLATGLSSILLLAPSVLHRLRWRRHDKEQLLRISNRLAVAGTAVLAIAIVAVVWVFTNVIYGNVVAAAAAGGLGAVIAGLWYELPLGYMRKSGND